jgi:hypothetical protein
MWVRTTTLQVREKSQTLGPSQISSGSCERASKPADFPISPTLSRRLEKPTAAGPRGCRTIAVGLSLTGVLAPGATLAGSIGTGGVPGPPNREPSPPDGARRAGDAIVAKPSRMLLFDGRVESRGTCCRSAAMSGIDFFVRSAAVGDCCAAAAES